MAKEPHEQNNHMIICTYPSFLNTLSHHNYVVHILLPDHLPEVVFSAG